MSSPGPPVSLDVLIIAGHLVDLLPFRGSGPSDGQQAAIVAADVKRYGVSSVGDP